MKDLYKRLNINENASQQQIEQALLHCEDEQIKEDGAYVLLNAARRMVYDRNHRTLKLIGALRERMVLNNTPHWNIQEYGDYINAVVTTVHERSVSANLETPVWIENARIRFWVLFGAYVFLYVFLYILFQ
jgi:hypothetical protein